LLRIESKAFSSSSLESIEIPRNVEILGSSCFSYCQSLSLISFEPDSQLKRIEAHVFEGCYFPIIVPSIILFIASNASRESFEISLVRENSCPEYARWQQLRCFGIQVDFRRIRRFDLHFPPLSDCLFNLFGFCEGSGLRVNDGILTRKYQGCENGIEIVVKSIKLSAKVEGTQVERRIENLMNLRHRCISGTIGVIFHLPLQSLEIVRKYSVGGSLSEVISGSPDWWTPTAKAKAIVGIVLSMRFAHSYGLVHGHFTANNVLFDEDGVIEICDFCVKSLSEVGGNSEAIVEVGGFSKESWRPEADVRGFAELLSQIVIDGSSEENRISQSVPAFVLKTIEQGQSSDSNATVSFVEIFETLKSEKFKILEGVDSKEVFNFVSWIELSERLTE
jgi:serine/threonine protein kinase